MTKMARFSARCASLGVAFAFALHIAQPWANAGAVQRATSNTKKAKRNFPKGLMSYCTPSRKIRPASGKKKKYMMMKHAVTENTSIHRMSARSNFRCMK
jgi:hypothetical protein